MMKHIQQRMFTKLNVIFMFQLDCLIHSYTIYVAPIDCLLTL